MNNNIFIMSLKCNFKNKKVLFCIYILFKILLVLIPTVTLYFNNHLYNYLITSFDKITVISYLIGYLASSILLASTFRYLSNVISIKLKDYSTIEAKRMFNTYIVNLDYELMEDNNIYNDMNVMRSIYTDLIASYVFDLLEIIFDMGTLISVLVYLFTLKMPILVIIILLISSLYYFVIKNNNTSVYYDRLRKIPEIRQSNYLYRILSNRNSLKEIKTDDSSNYILHEWKSKRKRIINETKKLKFRTLYKKIYIDLIYYIAFCLILLFLFFKLKSTDINIGVFTSLYYGFIEINGLVIGLLVSTIFLNLQIKDYKEKIYLLNKKEKKEQKVIFENNIKLENIKYQYPNSPKEVIDDLSLSILKGQKIGIVGENGCGKTTLIKIILGLLTPQSGKIKINDEEVKEYKILNISGLFQNFVSYAASIKDSVVISEKIDNDKLAKIYRTVKLEQVIERLELKDDTTIGQVFPNSIELSGGEKQRLAFARCLYRDNAELYFLDEPTSSLDVNFEIDVYKTFLEELKNKTLIMVSHRLAFTKFMDKIIVMDKGKVIECGTHNELMEIKGHYYNMYTKQLELIKGIGD